jgi:hypothetical protein
VSPIQPAGGAFSNPYIKFDNSSLYRYLDMIQDGCCSPVRTRNFIYVGGAEIYSQQISKAQLPVYSYDQDYLDEFVWHSVLNLNDKAAKMDKQLFYMKYMKLS